MEHFHRKQSRIFPTSRPGNNFWFIWMNRVNTTVWFWRRSDITPARTIVIDLKGFSHWLQKHALWLVDKTRLGEIAQLNRNLESEMLESNHLKINDHVEKSLKLSKKSVFREINLKNFWTYVIFWKITYLVDSKIIVLTF